MIIAILSEHRNTSLEQLKENQLLCMYSLPLEVFEHLGLRIFTTSRDNSAAAVRQRRNLGELVRLYLEFVEVRSISLHLSLSLSLSLSTPLSLHPLSLIVVNWANWSLIYLEFVEVRSPHLSLTLSLSTLTSTNW